MVHGLKVLWLSFIFAALSGAVDPASTGSIEALTQVDVKQKEMVAKADISGLANLSHPWLRINAPTNRVLTRDQFLSLMRSGKIAAEAFERTQESVSITGNIGIVMGHEVFTPTPNSELGEKYGAKPLNRRYTNVYLWENGRWLWLVRHANVVVER